MSRSRSRSTFLKFEYLLIYFALVAATGLTFILVQHRAGSAYQWGMNKELEASNQFLAALSSKISRYLPPQIIPARRPQHLGVRTAAEVVG